MYKIFRIYAPAGKHESIIEIPHLVRMDGISIDYYSDTYRTPETPLSYLFFGFGDYSKPTQYIIFESDYSLYEKANKNGSLDPMSYIPLGTNYRDRRGNSFFYYKVFNSIDEASVETYSDLPIHLVPLQKQ